MLTGMLNHMRFLHWSPRWGWMFRSVWLFAAGFWLLAALPVVLDWSEIHAGPERQGGAVGFLLMAGNLGGLVVVLVVQAAIGSPYLALGAMAVVTLLGLPVVTRLPARTRAAAPV